MSDFRLGAALQTFSDHDAAVSFARSHHGNEALVAGADGRITVYELETSSAAGTAQLQQATDGHHLAAVMTSDFAPSCLAFVVDQGGRSQEVAHLDLAKHLQSYLQSDGFTQLSGADKVALLERLCDFMRTDGVLSASETTTLQQLAQAVSTAVGSADQALSDRIAAVVARIDRIATVQNQTQAWTASYTVNGQTVTSRAPFRMVGGSNQPTPQQAYSLISKTGIEGRNGITRQDILLCQMGRGTPDQLRRVTQALIDAGELSSTDVTTPPTDTAQMIRRLQWKFGLGADCQGSLRPVISAFRGSTLPDPAGDLIQVDRSGRPVGASAQHFTPVANPDGKGVAAIREGDVLKLDATDDVGHYVVVTQSRSIAADSPETQAMGLPAVQGPLQVMNVFSSWGAAGDPDYAPGGVRSAVWVCDTGANPPTWYSLNPQGRYERAANTFDDHTFVGAYRPH